MKEFKRIYLLSILVTFSETPLLANLDLPPEVANAFRNTTLSESGGLSSFGNERQTVIEHVKLHWRVLLDNLEEVPSANGSAAAAAMLVGAAAEELPPLDYLDFLEHFLTTYERDRIGDNLLRQQLGGDNRKNYFVTVNAAHPRVKAILLRAKELVPKENEEFQKYLDEELSGERSDMYFANESQDASPPETLPGVKLKSPFASIIDKAKRLTKSKDDDQMLASNGDAPDFGSALDAVVPEPGRWRHAWALGLALAVLTLAVWRAFAKRRISKI